MIDWQALAQIDASRCEDWQLKDLEFLDWRIDESARMSDKNRIRTDKMFWGAVSRDYENRTVEAVAIDHVDAQFDEAAGYA